MADKQDEQKKSEELEGAEGSFGKREKVWTTRYPEKDREDPEVRAEIEELARRLGLSVITARLLYLRGYRTFETAEAFLKNDDAILHDPFQMKDMEKAVARIREGIRNKEKIVIYGDYDVDGVTSVSMLYLFLCSKGADIGYYIPSRSGEGYGLSKGALDRLVEKQVSLVITVDTGITATEEAVYAKSLGMDMVITDHHECKTVLPDACAVVNPHRPDCPYPFKELAGVGVVFKLLCAFEMTEAHERGIPVIQRAREVCNEYADLAAIGTIADVMPLIDENRLIVTYGLRMIAATRRRGLSALIDAASNGNQTAKPASSLFQKPAPKKRKITSGFIGYGIAPRLNAAGRISNATKAVELLLADSEERAKALAEELCEINHKRQVEENRIAEEAYEQLEQNADFRNDRILVLENDSWQQGIIGIVSSRITERYGLPSILISFEGSTEGGACQTDIGKGSGRSIKGLNLVEAMNACEDLLVKYGGHELAAGLTVQRANVGEFRRRINEYARTHLPEDFMKVSVEADCEVEIGELTMQLALELYRLEPFGVSNPTPTFILRDVRVQKIIPVSGGKHTKLVVVRDGITFYAMYFGMTAYELGFFEGDRVDLLFTLDINEYRNLRTLQLIVQDAGIAKKYTEELGKEKKRLTEIRAGESFFLSEQFLPDREDIAQVYTYLRNEYRVGHTVLSEHILRATLAGLSDGKLNYVKIALILDILRELDLISAEITDGCYYEIELYRQTGKKNLDDSQILGALRRQCKEG